jgi:hypothetical protein
MKHCTLASNVKPVASTPKYMFAMVACAQRVAMRQKRQHHRPISRTELDWMCMPLGTPPTLAGSDPTPQMMWERQNHRPNFAGFLKRENWNGVVS